MERTRLLAIGIIFLLLISYRNEITYAYDALNTTLSSEEMKSDDHIVKTLVSLNHTIQEVESNSSFNTYPLNFIENREVLPALPSTKQFKNFNTYSGIAGNYWVYNILECEVELNLEAKKRVTDVVYNTTNSYVTSNSRIDYLAGTTFDLKLSDFEKDEIIFNHPSSWKSSASLDNNIELYLSPNTYGWVEFAPFYYKVTGVISFYNWHGDLKEEKIVTTLVPKNDAGILEGIYYFMESNNSP